MLQPKDIDWLNGYKNNKDVHQTTGEENKRGREEKGPTKTKPKQLKNGNRNLHKDNYLK